MIPLNTDTVAAVSVPTHEIENVLSRICEARLELCPETVLYDFHLCTLNSLYSKIVKGRNLSQKEHGFEVTVAERDVMLEHRLMDFDSD